MAPLVPTTHRILRTDAPDLAVHSWGGEGPPTLLCHPTGFHGRVWAPVAERLIAAGRSVWSLDFRGHGDSGEEPDGTYHWERFADDALAVAHEVGIAGDPGLVAVGHSKGGAALLLGEEREPGTYARLWLFEPIVFPSRDTDRRSNPLADGARRRRRVWGSREEAYANYARKRPLSTLHPDALRAYVDHGLRDLADGTVELKCHPEHEAAVYSMGAMHTLWDRLGNITAPTTVACGAVTDTITPQYAAQIAARIPGATLLAMDGLGHFGPIEDPDTTAAAILGFAEA
jgi:pimeloyl-ACP methyl ester carboxylesterase